MPQEHKSRREVLDAIKAIPSTTDLLSMHEGHYTYELDLEVTVYGRNYGGKKVGPYVKLLSYGSEEDVIKEGDWGGNTFFVLVEGKLDVFLRAAQGKQTRVAVLEPYTQFGEMSVIAGVPRNATIKPPAGGKAKVLEIQRPALRLLRKIPAFGDALDKSYRMHGRNSAIEYLRRTVNLNDDLVNQLRSTSLYRVYAKNHVLFREGTPLDRIYVIKEGWLHRSIEKMNGPDLIEDFLGKGMAFGLEGVTRSVNWPYTATLMGRTEILEISISKLRQYVELRGLLITQLASFAPPAFPQSPVPNKPEVSRKMLAAQDTLIRTGLVDGSNLLVMDMDLCVRCGNCSLACHKVHGQSRLLRRGVHLTRLEAPRMSALQNILSPEVCMHCQDPECLSGCPTGAIGRFGDGQVDIDPKTCIGCGDCATQCPYDAISMIPRRPAAKPAVTKLKAWITDLLRIQAEPLPPSVDQTDDLVAVKCNLCNGTGLNPKGSKTQAYSCEENCPTGALARIDPRTYFTEIGNIEGLLLLDQTHAVGRNIHKSDPPKRLAHILGILLTVLLTAASVYALDKYGLGARIYGFLNMRWITGLVGLVAITGVMMYPFRRQVYRRRAGPLRYWLLSHTYLGVIASIMIVLHGGTDTGGWLTSALMYAFDLTILTGLLGIFLYFAGPRLLTRIEGAPLLIDDLKARREELKQELAEIETSGFEPLRRLVAGTVLPKYASFGYLLSQYLKRKPLNELITAGQEEFKQRGAALKSDRYQEKLNQAIAAAIALRRIDALIYVHRLLKIWLPPHVVFTSLMLALLIVHIIQVIYYSPGF